MVGVAHLINLDRRCTGPEEREFAITSFKDGRKDVLIASGVGSKGLDFEEIKVSAFDFQSRWSFD